MKRPRIALWIKGSPLVRWLRGHFRWPRRLWSWADRRVDRWHLMTATLPQWTPVRLPSKTFIVDQELADMMGLKDDEGLWPDHPLEDME